MHGVNCRQVARRLRSGASRYATAGPPDIDAGDIDAEAAFPSQRWRLARPICPGPPENGIIKVGRAAFTSDIRDSWTPRFAATDGLWTCPFTRAPISPKSPLDAAMVAVHGRAKTAGRQGANRRTVPYSRWTTYEPHVGSVPFEAEAVPFAVDEGWIP